jgi:hypothetical protein
MPELHWVVSSIEGVVARSLGQVEQLLFFARIMLNIDSFLFYILTTKNVTTQGTASAKTLMHTHSASAEWKLRFYHPSNFCTNIF